MKATITDVAREAGVSMKTVSRVLNNERNVAQKTRDRVMEVAKRLRYSPNLAARGLASSKTYLIALIYDNPNAHYFITHLQRGAIDACRQKGYHLVLVPAELRELKTPLEVKAASEKLLEHLDVDGVIVAPPASNFAPLIDVVQSLKLPLALVAPSDVEASIPSVNMDHMAASYELTARLIALGHKRIACIKGHDRHSSAGLRLAGYRQALSAAGLPIDPDLIKDGDYSFRSGLTAAEDLLGMEDRPTAIFASNDDMAAAVVNVAARRGLSIPNELSICGFDDTPLAQIIWPQLSTVKQPIYDMGYGAAEMLLQPNISDAGQTSRLYDYTIMMRGSTGPLGGVHN